MQRLINGMTYAEYVNRDSHKVKLVDFETGNKAWTVPIGEANRGSHKTLTDAGLRVNKFDDQFRAWHQPSCETVTEPIEPVTEFGLEMPCVTRKLRTIKTSGLSVKRAPKEQHKSGEWNAINIEESDDTTAPTSSVSRSGHAAYMRDKEERERRLNIVYENYCKGTAPSKVLFTHVERHIRTKASFQWNLKNVRNEVVADADDLINEFLAGTWPHIERKTVTGPLHHWLNRAFKFCVIDVQKKLTKEWDWRRYLAGEAARNPELSEAWSERLEEAAQQSLIGDDAPQPQPTTFYVPDPDNQDTTPQPEAVSALEHRQFSRRIKDAAVVEFRKRHADDLHGSVVRLTASAMDGKQIARHLGISESKVSRLKIQAKQEILEIGREFAGVTDNAK